MKIGKKLKKFLALNDEKTTFYITSKMSWNKRQNNIMESLGWPEGNPIK